MSKMSLEEVQSRDAEKRRLCKEIGITLIEVPFWWDGTLSSLQVKNFIKTSTYPLLGNHCIQTTRFIDFGSEIEANIIDR